MTTETSYLLTLFMGTILGLLSAHIAMRKERSPLVWFLIGFFFGIIGLFVLFLVRPIGFGSDLSAEDPSATSNAAGDIVPVAAEDNTILTLPDVLDTADWYYLDKDWLQQGPISLKQLQVLWMEGQVEGATQVWHPSLPAWQSIESLPKLIDYLAQK
jgi:hypothetical protein